MRPATERHVVLRCATGALLLAMAATSAANEPPKQTARLHIHLVGNEEGRTYCHSSVGESVFGKLVSLIAQPLLEGAVGGIGNAIVKASGELDKTHVSKVSLRDYSYSVSSAKQSRIMNPAHRCMFVYRAAQRLTPDQLQQSTQSPQSVAGLDFLARFSTVFSRDASGFAVTLEQIYYPKRFSEGRDVTGATLSLSFVKPGDATYATAAFPGSKWVPGESKSYSKEEAPTTGWLIPRPMSDSENASLQAYLKQCAVRRSAASALRASLRMQIGALKAQIAKEPSEDLAATKKRLEDALLAAAELPLPTPQMAETLVCGYSLPAQVRDGEELGSTWSADQEKQLRDLEGLVKKHGAMSIRFEWIETKDVNKFWLAVGNAVNAKKADIASTIATEVVTAKREAAELANEVADLQAQGAYEVALAGFQAKKRAYEVLATNDPTSAAALNALNDAIAKKYEVLVAARKLGIEPPRSVVDFPQ